jgi:hypothetical protein
MNRIWPRKIITPHVDLGVSLHVGVAVLRSTGAVVSEEVEGEERTYRVSLPGYQMAIYERGGFVSSVWYDDPAGRLTPFGKRRKIKLYMDRFTKNGSWQLRINNGWMKFYFNNVDHMQLVYGLHMDVIRINSWEGDLSDEEFQQRVERFKRKREQEEREQETGNSD